VQLTKTPIQNLLRRNRPKSRPAQAEPTPPPRPVYTLPAAPPEAIHVRALGDSQPAVLVAATGVADEVMRNKYVERALGVLDIYGKAGGGLFAAALAYSTMFAIIPLVLLMAGVVGWLVEDPVQREQLLTKLISYFPPLADLFKGTLDGLVAARGAFTLIGLIGLIWGASSFYAGLDEVMRRIFGGKIRGQFDRRGRGVIAIIVLIALMAGTILLSGVWAFVNQLASSFPVWTFLVPIIVLVIFVFVVLMVYLLVPTAPPSVRAGLPPAIIFGIGIGLLTNLFGVLAPLLIGGLSGLGVIATAFGVLIWLNFSFQMLLYGASWACLRRDLERERASVVEL
jgi:membrane protein